MGGGVPGAQGTQQPGTGKFGGIASQGAAGSNPFQQYQGMGAQQASPGNSYYPQTQQQAPQAGAGKYGGMTGQQSVPQGVPPEVSQQYQQQRPFQAQQPNYGALFSSLASMFGGQQSRAPFSNYQPVQSANNFQLRNTYQFDPATDPSRQYAAKVKAEAEQKEAEAAAAKAAADAAAQSQTQQTSYEMGSPGNARGGRINGGDKKIRAALLTAKGVQAKAVPSSHGIDNVHTVIDPATVDHPAADIPGIHLRAGRMGKAGGGALTAPGMPAPEEEEEPSITAYHGSPHDFEQFDPAYIGKGEGAQAFGHGMYFAADEGVAKGYRDALSGDLVTPEGERTNWQGQGSKYFGLSALQQSMDKKLSGDEAIRDAMQDLHFNAGLMQRRDIKQRYNDAANSLGSMLGKQWKIDPGHMYEVRLKAKPEHFLDWDKPLSDQHPHVIAALQMNRELPRNTGLNTDKTYSKTLGHFVASDTTGKDVVYGNPDAKNLSERLSAAGIRGIRYLDAGSRSQGEGTHNYVVFDPKHIEVARKYERGGEVEGEAEPQPQFSVSNPMPVFPKPQRMWDDQRPGGAYLSMPDKADVTGHRAAQAEIGVNPGGKPFFNASRDAVEATGTPGRGSAIVKTNLFKKKAGWQWAQAPEGHEATDTIVSVDHRGKHHYALNVQFPKGVDLSRYEKATSEPRLRPTTKGNLEFGEQAGTILVRGKEHPVYHNVTVRSSGGRVGYAGGGGEDDPTVQKALGLTQQAQPMAQPDPSPIPGAMQVAQAVTAPGRRRFEIAPARVAPMTIDQKDRDLPEEGGVTIKRLTDAFKRAIDNHLSLPPAQQIANARQAENNVAKYVGRGKEGKMNSVLTANKKLMKAQTAGENNTPLTLPDGRTLEMTGLPLMPDYREGQFKMCGNSDVCRDLCLGKESGQYRYDKTATQTQIPTTKEEVAEAGNKPRMSAFRRTMAMMRDPESFAVYLHELIDGAKIMAERRGSHLGVRLNVLSDLSPKIMEPIIKAHPEVSFYDYTKMNYDPVAPNHHYTYSSTGLSQPERGVENPFSNWRKLRDRLDQGHNVAMAFAHGKGDAFPEHLHDEETGKKYRVVSGDEHDFRPMDMVPEGEDGVIVALKNMAASNSEYKYENAARNSHGFFVHHEPNFERTARGTFVRDENGNRISRSKIYNVSVQPMKRGAMRQKED